MQDQLDIEAGDVIVVQFGSTEWVVEVAEAPRERLGFRGSTVPQMILVANLDRAQFGRYPTRVGDQSWFSLDEVIAR
jgi:hypothetical protein